MTAFFHVVERLKGHDRAVRHARPYGEPDETLVRLGVSRGQEQKHAQRRVDGDDHHQIVRVSMSPAPAGRPDDAQRINTEYESQAEDDQRDTKIKPTICIRHFSLHRHWKNSFGVPQMNSGKAWTITDSELS